MKILGMMILSVSVLHAQEIVAAGMQPEGYELTLTEEVRFGAVEEDDHYQWPSLQTKILPAPNGQMYIFDHNGSRVLLFNEQGQFVKQVARPGEGPGELQYITSVSQTPSGQIYIMDTPSPGNLPKIKRFNADMSFRDEFPTREMPLRPDSLYSSDDEKNLGGLFVTFDPVTKGLALKTGILRLEDNVLLNVFYEDTSPLGLASIKDQNRWIEMIAQKMKQEYRSGLMAMGSDGTVYTATSDKYVISQWKPGEKTARRLISRKYKPRLFTDKDRAALIDHQYENMDESARATIARSSLEKGFEKANLVVHPPLVGIIRMENKGILVIREADVLTRKNLADVFSIEGKFLCEIQMSDAGMVIKSPGNWTPNIRLVFHKDKAYTIHTDENGDNMAVRYSYVLNQPK